MATPFMLGDNSMQTFFDKNLKGCTFPVSQLSGFFGKPVWYLYGCLHIANRITWNGKMSTQNLWDLTEDGAPWGKKMEAEVYGSNV